MRFFRAFVDTLSKQRLWNVHRSNERFEAVRKLFEQSNNLVKGKLQIISWPLNGLPLNKLNLKELEPKDEI